MDTKEKNQNKDASREDRIKIVDPSGQLGIDQIEEWRKKIARRLRR
jgi:hypothetical protein